MTKLVIVLAVVVVVILVVVFVAVRNMRAEDPEEFADRPPRRAGNRGRRDDHDLSDGRREAARRQPAGASRGGRATGRPADGAYRPAAGATRGLDERRDHRDDSYDQRGRAGRGYAEDSDAARRRSNGDRRSASRPTRPKGRPGEASARSRSARSRLSGDSSEWDSSEWEKLSDIDYWTELASDKPLTTTAQPATQDRPERPRTDREAETAAIRTRPAAGLGPADVGLGEVDAGPAGTVPRAVPRRDPVTGLPVRDWPQPADAELAVAADRQAELAAAPVPAAAAEGQLHPLADPRPPRSRHAGPVGAPARSLAPDRQPAAPDDDPLTSPSFPRVPASDSRSYHSGRTSTPPRGSRVPEHLAPTQEFRSYGSPVPQHAAARPAAPADVGGDTDRTNPNSYLPDPLPNGNPYPAPNGSPYPVPNGDPYSLPPAPASAASGNPYGSYVTSDGQDPAFGYGDYPAAHGNGHESYLSAPVSGSTGRHSANGHRPHAQPTAARVSSPGITGYPDGPAPGPAPRDPGAQADYQNDYGQQRDHAGYLPSGYPAGSHNPAGYGRQDRYGPDGYGGYPEYGPAEN